MMLSTLAVLIEVLWVSSMAVADSVPPCSTFQAICVMNPDQSLMATDNNNDDRFITVPIDGSYYLSFQMPVDTYKAYIDLSLLYGSMNIYVSKNKQPTSTAYDYSNTATEGSKDSLELVSLKHTKTDIFNVLLKPIDGDSISTYFTGVLSFGTLNSINIKNHRNGMPVVMRFDGDAQRNFVAPMTGDKIQVIITTYASHRPGITLLKGTDVSSSSSSSSVVALPSSYYQEDSDAADGFVSIVPASGDAESDLMLQLTSNTSTYFSFVIRSLHYDNSMKVNPLASSITLLDGSPQVDRVMELHENYYVFYVPPGMSDDITISVDSVMGDSDLFVNPSSTGFYFRSPDPSPEPAVWTSQKPSGTDKVIISRKHPSYIFGGGAYYITVFGFKAAHYTVRVSTTAVAALLMEGYKIEDSVSAGKYKYYRFHDSDPTHDLLIDVLPSIGDPDIAIGCSFDPTGDDNGYPSKKTEHFEFFSGRYLEDTITITADDPARCSSSGLFYLAVYGFKDSTYSLSAQHDFAERIISAGQPQTMIIYKNHIQRYRIRVGYEAADLIIRSNPLYGDCDLYVKMNKLAQVYDFDYRSNAENTVEDLVTVPENEICDNCWIHITVYGYLTSQYTLVASFIDGTIVLSNGQPQTGSVAYRHIQYYSYLVKSSGIVSTVLTVTSGSNTAPSMHMSKVVRYPSPTSLDTMHRTSHVANVGLLPRLDFRGVVEGDWIFIGIEGSDNNCTYIVHTYETPADTRDHPRSLLILPNGKPQDDDITLGSSGFDQWLYYQINAPTGHDSIIIRYTVDAGSIELYASHCMTALSTCAMQSSLPNATHYIATTALTPEATTLEIKRQDDQPSQYIVGVRSLRDYSSYQISATFDNTILLLKLGVSVMDYVVREGLEFFSFFLPNEPYTMLRISLTPISGDPDLFVSASERYPSSMNNTWRSTRFGTDTISIDPSTDDRAPVPCMYYIAVYGATESSFTISASLSSTIPTLSDGVPASGSVEQSQWIYYMFHDVYQDSRDFQIELSSIGDADLYVTLDGSIPSRSNFIYSGIDSHVINIAHTDSDYISSCITDRSSDCMIKVGIYGVTATTFTLTLTSSSSATTLQYDVTRSDAVASHLHRYYKAVLETAEPSSLRFSITPITGHVQLFVSCKTMQPNSTNAGWSLADIDGTGTENPLEIFSINAVESGCVQSMRSSSATITFYAAVYGLTAASYSIVVNDVDKATVPLLRPGASTTYKQLLSGDVDYYFVRPGSIYDDIHLLLSTTSGEVVAYVSATWDDRPRIGSYARPNDMAVPTPVESFLYSSLRGDISSDLTIRSASIDKMCMGRSSRSSSSSSSSDCYFIVAVVAKTDPSTSTYSILMTRADSAIVLYSGIPRASQVSTGRFRYFTYSLQQLYLDVTFAVTPITGDPDLYISMAPLAHPTRENFTWFHSSYGADSLTIQYEDIHRRCHSEPGVDHRSCEFRIGVFAFINSTFTILASINEGFQSPIRLVNRVPQSGSVLASQYAYYKYTIDNSTGIRDIKFTLTPSSDGDADMYVLIERPGEHVEPGMSHFDYRSVGYGSVTEEIVITSTSSLYCLDCTMYIAVYGYKTSHYSLQASSTGIMTLLAGRAHGGHVLQGSFTHYLFHNSLEFASMTIYLTMITSDADLYVLAHASNTPIEYPTRTLYTWRSQMVGSDTIKITYEDTHYCSDCDYIISVYGYGNSTYTLLVTEQEDYIVKLVQNRPQVASMDVHTNLMYFSVPVESSLADTTIAVTMMNTGSLHLFAQEYNLTTFYSPQGGDGYSMPSPSEPSTYSYSTVGTPSDNFLFIPGPHPIDTLIIVAVQATSPPIRFSIIAASSQYPALIVGGLPQNHYVDAGSNAVFKFFPSEDEDLRITVTARSGDPDLFVSTTSQQPHCEKIQRSSFTETKCSNYTWSSRNYMTDQIIISRDYPCTAMLPSIYIAPDCDPLVSYQPATGSPVYIGVFGYSVAKFSLLVSPVGQQVQLLAGQPLLSRTAPGFVCSSRSQSNSVCLPSSVDSEEVQVSYFSFRASDHSKKDVIDATNGVQHSSSSSFDLIITVVPSCNASSSLNKSQSALKLSNYEEDDDDCLLGCDCSPLTIYMNSCPLSDCKLLDHKPSHLDGQHAVSAVVKAGGGSSIYLSTALTSEGNRALCDPSIANQDCMYFIAVAGSHAVYSYTDGALFTITARTPDDVTLVPCSNKQSPDGIKFISNDFTQSRLYYELCSQQYSPSVKDNQLLLSKESLVVELDQCSGSTSLYACAGGSATCKDFLPSPTSYGYYSNSEQSCVSRGRAKVKDSCRPTNRPVLSLPQSNGNYFVMVTGSGKFAITISTTENGRSLSPKLVVSGMDTSESKRVTLLSSTGNSLVVSFRQSLVLMPGLDNPLQADYMSYTAYVINHQAISNSEKKVDEIDDDTNYMSMCGINDLIETKLHQSDFTKTRIKINAATQGADSITYKLGKLSISTNYRVIVIALCDSLCLQQLSKLHDDPRLLLSCVPTQVGAACKPQSLLYTYLDASTGDTADMSDLDNNEDSNGRKDHTQDFISLSIVVIAVLVIIVFATSMYCMKHNADTPNCLQLMLGLGGRYHHHRPHRHRHLSTTIDDDDDDDDDDDVFGDSTFMGRGKAAWSNTFQIPSHSQQTDRMTASTEMISLSSSSRTAVSRAAADSDSGLSYLPPTPTPITSSHSRRGGNNNNNSWHSQREQQHLSSSGVGETAKKLLDKWVVDPIRSSARMKKTLDDDVAVTADQGTKYTSLPLLDDEELELHL